MMRFASLALVATALVSCSADKPQTAESKSVPGGVTCQAYFSGYEIEGNKCVSRGGSGCSNPFSYSDLNECQAALASVVKYEVALEAGGFWFHVNAELLGLDAQGAVVTRDNALCQGHDLDATILCEDASFSVVVGRSAGLLELKTEAKGKTRDLVCSELPEQQGTPIADGMATFLKCSAR